MLSGNYYGSEIRQGIFWGLNFGLGVFLGFEFCPIRSSLSLEIRRTSLPPLWEWGKVNMIRRVCLVQYRIVFWFHFLNGSFTLIRAETERYDIVRFSSFSTKSLASETRKIVIS